MKRLPERTETARLLLRQLTPADEPAMGASLRDSADHIGPWLPWMANEPISPADRRELMSTWEQEWRDGGDAIFGIFLEDEHIGNAGLHRRGTADSLEIGYWLHAGHTGRGYMTEASSALTTLAFTQPGIERVAIHHDRANVASGAVPRRLGFILTREVPKPIEAPGEEGVEYQWEVSRDAWAARAAAI